MFKNMVVYRIGPEWQASLTVIESSLQKMRFAPCGATQKQSVGWVEPRGLKHAPLVESIGGQYLLKLQVEQRVLPGAVVKRRTEELARKVEDETGRKPGKKQTKELKEQAELELLPMAFTKQSSIHVWIDPARHLLMLDTSSSARAEDVITSLVKSLDGFAVSLLQTKDSAAVAMKEWLASGEPPSYFTIDRECELKSMDEMKSVVRYARHLLDTDEVKAHIVSGKMPTRLAMTWEGRVSFVLTESMQLKKLAFLDVVFEGHKPGKDEAFDADAAIATTEMSKLIPDLIDALGGELQLQQ
ncbi:recombination-associated protein RdgC [Aquabacterium sp.]|uniref:recombination-associated protein RdgC n=1 Tax=Aquabacterium sp. TaxID=1872578 RepID=UPI002E3273E8|nr:recombination-associated protein RdgC [Aquabacterium sp.]HEX5312163.1 recombination-associated protein RdgC [Aquabacterium sp.]